MEWRDITGYAGLYQVSSAGDIRRLPGEVQKSDGVVLSVAGGMLKKSKSTGGYRSVRLSKGGKTKAVLIHVLVWLCFGDKPKMAGMHIDHINEDKSDNRIENLQLLSHRQNNTKSKALRNRFTGASYDARRKKYVAAIYVNGKSKTLGRYDTIA